MNYKNNKRSNQGTTLLEMMVVMGIFTSVMAMIFLSMIHFGRGHNKTRDIAIKRRDLANFVAGAYTFANNSLSAYFEDNDGSELNYRNPSSPFTDRDSRLDIIYFVKDDDGNLGRMVYNDVENRIEWLRNENNNSDIQIMLEGVYRFGTIWDDAGVVTEGVDPIFKFPHRSFLYDLPTNPNRPKFIILNFLKVVVNPTFNDPKPKVVPVTLRLEINVSRI